MNPEFDQTPTESTSTVKWAIASALVVLVCLIAFAPRNRVESVAPVAAEIDVRAATAAEINSSGYRGEGPRFAEPRNRPSAYEEAQAWAAETDESDDPSEPPPTF